MNLLKWVCRLVFLLAAIGLIAIVLIVGSGLVTQLTRMM